MAEKEQTAQHKVYQPHKRHRPGGLVARIGDGIWARLPQKYRQNVWPEVRLLPGEEIQLEILMAWYRDITSVIVFGFFWWLMGIVLLAMAAIFFLAGNWALALIPLGLLAMGLFEAVREYIEYNQWRLIKTNKRLIIIMPQHNSWPLVDNIEMGMMPRIIDTNWSPNVVWRLFQFLTGARDVYISLTGLQFVAGTARVKDALIIPDVTPEDVFELKRLVFG